MKKIIILISLILITIISYSQCDNVAYMSIPLTEHFGFPLGYPDMNGYYNANPFLNITSHGKHLGADLNKDGDSDLGDTIYSIGNGRVWTASPPLIVILHRTTDPKYPIIRALYYHSSVCFVDNLEVVTAGQPIALVGKVQTVYAHLHFAIITDLTSRFIFYEEDPEGYIDPVKFIKEHR